MSGTARIFCHSEIVEYQSGIAIELTHFLGNASYTFGFYDADGESSESSDVFRAVTGADSAAIFVIIPINDVVATIFDTPMAPVCIEKLLGVGLLRGSARDAVRDFTGFFTALFFYAVPFYNK
jgi:hypothetical protein